MVKTSDYRAIRGLTVAVAILDEVAFWDSEGASPDREVLTALRPATSTIPGAKLIAISTPYSQVGSLFDAHRDHYGKDDDHVLVWQSNIRTMNPTIDEGLLQREIERDPDAGRAEWLATFRTDLESALSFGGTGGLCRQGARRFTSLADNSVGSYTVHIPMVYTSRRAGLCIKSAKRSCHPATGKRQSHLLRRERKQ